MPLLTRYTCQDTFFHRLDPRTKLVWLVAMLVLYFATSQLALLGGLIAVTLAVSRAAKLDFKSFLPMTKVMIPLAIGVLVVQLVFRGEGAISFHLGPVAIYGQGGWVAAEVILRLYGIILLFLQFLTWTHPTDLSLVLVKAKLPYKYAMLIGLTLRFFPVLEEELGQIFEAQEARGVALRGALRRGLAFGPILLPFCLRTLRRANEVALAMEMRAYGFRSERTFLRTIGYRPADYALTAGLLLGLTVYLAARTYHMLLW